MRGFLGLRCPECNEENQLKLDLEILRVECSCGHQIEQDNIGEVAAHFQRQSVLWGRLQAWIIEAP